ncbi:MAG: rhomboid family intramembrane serine protease [Chloroflexota bacterium]
MIPIEDTPEQRRRHFPFVTLLLIAINVAVFLYALSLGSGYSRFIQTFGVVPAEITIGRDIWPPSPIPVYLTLITSMFLHAGILHLAGNMIFLWVFGDNVEDVLGHLAFLGFYLVCGIVASLLQIISNPISPIPNVGASGAIAGVLGGYLLLFPRANVRTLLFAVPFITITRVSAVLLILVWFAFQLASALLELGFAGVRGSGVAFWAHIGGFIAGLTIVALWKAAQREPTGAG